MSTQRLINRRAVRDLAMEACTEFGIPATRVSKAFLTYTETKVREFVKSHAVSLVQNNKKTIQ
jgi:hypothetical protein